jgi:hypothetical protein
MKRRAIKTEILLRLMQYVNYVSIKIIFLIQLYALSSYQLKVTRRPSFRSKIARKQQEKENKVILDFWQQGKQLFLYDINYISPFIY